MNIKKTKKKMTPAESIDDAKKRGIKFGDYGGEDIFDNDGNFLEVPKIRITTMIDLDLKDKLKEVAAKNRMKYQTLLNQIIREYFEPKNKLRLEQRISILEERIEKIDQEETG